jgi:hypothetical protein
MFGPALSVRATKKAGRPAAMYALSHQRSGCFFGDKNKEKRRDMRALLHFNFCAVATAIGQLTLCAVA